MDTFEVGTDEKKETRNPNNCYYSKIAFEPQKYVYYKNVAIKAKLH